MENHFIKGYSSSKFYLRLRLAEGWWIQRYTLSVHMVQRQCSMMLQPRTVFSRHARQLRYRSLLSGQPEA